MRTARALALWLGLLVAAMGCDRGAVPRRGAETSSDGSSLHKEVLEISLLSPPTEAGGGGPLAPPSPSLLETVQALDEAARDDTVAGLFLRVGPMHSAWSRVAELAGALGRVRAAHKPVHCHFEVLDNAGYALVARGCDRITMTPAGHLGLVGVAAQVFYLRSLLATIGVRADILQVGRFKGAADPFTEDDMPPASREAMEAMVGDLTSMLAETVAQRIGSDTDRARRVLDEGPFDGDTARTVGLIDDLEFDDEARKHAREAARADGVRVVRLGEIEPPRSLAGWMALLSPVEARPPVGEPRLALVRLRGTIVDGDTSAGGEIRSGPYVRELRRLADDPDVKAVVLRIDSPGGSALASDLLWHAVRRLAARKPVIASIGDMGASGGYYVASAASEVFAEDASLVGSIGVVGGKLDVSPLLERVGVRGVVVSGSAHAAWWSPARPWSETDRVIVERMMRGTYDRFVARVATGRELDAARVAAAAEGRLMTGRRAHAAGLVTTLGGLDASLRRARALGRLPDDAAIETYPGRRGLIEALGAVFGSGEASVLVGLALPELADGLGEVRALVDALASPSQAHVLVPFVMSLR